MIVHLIHLCYHTNHINIHTYPTHPISSNIIHHIYIYVCIYKNTYSFKVSKQNKKIIHQIWKKQSPGRKPRWTHRIFPGERKQHSLQYLWKFFWLEAILKSPRNKYKWFVFLEFWCHLSRWHHFQVSKIISFVFFNGKFPPQYPTYTVLCCLWELGNEGSKNPF